MSQPFTIVLDETVSRLFRDFSLDECCLREGRVSLFGRRMSKLFLHVRASTPSFWQEMNMPRPGKESGCARSPSCLCSNSTTQVGRELGEIPSLSNSSSRHTTSKQHRPTGLNRTKKSQTNVSRCPRTVSRHLALEQLLYVQTTIACERAWRVCLSSSSLDYGLLLALDSACLRDRFFSFVCGPN